MSLIRIYTASSTSPVVSLYGGAGDYEMILRYLDGWYSTPDAKVTLTERASGDGAHDVAEDDINYGVRTIVVDYRILTDSRTRLLAHEGSLLSLAHQQVRFRVTDDDSDLFASGYVDSVVKDKSQQNLAKQTETGTLTIVCPRPERLAWSTLQTQLFPVSMVQGGLRYSTTHELVSAWTGTSDASTSTLSQDGQVVATNLYQNPSFEGVVDTNVLVIKGTSSIVGPGVITPYHGTKRISLGLGDNNRVGVNIPNALLGGPVHMRMMVLGWDVGTTVSVAPDDGISFSPVTLTTSAATAQTWVPLDIDFTPQTGDYWILFSSTTGAIALDAFGFYTQSDWQAMQSLGVTWFDGDSYPVPTGKGLSYPLNYGTAGSSSNVALLLNNGSSKAFPVLTVTGSFPNGVQIQWGGNALQYDGAVGGVPLILDSRSQTASMGGVDVSRNLSRRDFPMVPGAGSVSLRLMSAGTGWVTAVCHDTYI